MCCMVESKIKCVNVCHKFTNKIGVKLSISTENDEKVRKQQQ